MAETWTCPVCSTVNEEIRKSCMVCGTDKSGIATVERPASEAPPGIILPEELLPPPPTPGGRRPPGRHHPPADAAAVGALSADSGPANGIEATLP